ncbi:MerR family transcriptional regulator [Gordonia phthalatica]|uniref:MerR family transcriptional regulator n=1 Tax=Gordonia phthalatica TaxID=1136941 RepID=A0A0N9NFD1_9ACTN|nr:MerR family transcriptional regulator [Gordonia phthalatica]ALG86421.1 MerR family transcriptional regulator [Gordonia phthalatica]
MRTGELARQSGVSVRSIRYYKEQGLLHPERLPSGYRVFTADDVVAVQRIQSLLAAGLSTQKIERVLPCLRLHDGLGLTCPDLLSTLVAERDGMLQRIDALRASVDALESVISASPHR